MKKILSFSIALLFLTTTRAQNDASASAAKDFNKLPEFQVTSVPDSVVFSGSSLKKDKPVVIILFNPDCEHCQHETKELLAWRQEIKDLQMVMVTTAAFDKAKEFYNDYNIASLTNIQMGCDIKYKLALLFRASSYPAIYIYDSKGALAKAYIGGASVQAILDAAK